MTNAKDTCLKAQDELYRHRTKILNRIYEDQDLINLYQNDACFRSSIEIAVESNKSWEDTIIFALKNGYKFKQEIFEQSVKLCQESIRPILLNK